MKIEVGMKCRQIKVIEEYGFDFVGKEFEITKVNDNVIMGTNMDYKLCFGIETDKFNDYFELIEEEEEEVKEKEENIMFKPISKTKKYKQIKPINIKGVDFMIDNVNFTIIKEANSFILCSPENTNYVLYITRDKFDECFELIEEEVKENKKENNIMPQTNNKLQTHENLHARLGDTIILSNGLKLKVCKDFSDGDIQYYKTVDISCNTNVTIGYTENDIKKFCIGKKIWGYDVDEFDIVDIERKQVKKKRDKVEQNKTVNLDKTVYKYKLFPRTVYWVVENIKTGENTYEPFNIAEQSLKLIVDGDRTTVIFDDGSKGSTKCLPTDKYDFEKGRKIAYKYALIELLKKEIKEMIK